MADSVAGGGEAGWGHSMPQAVRVLPYAHDGQLPVPEPHHSAGRCALQLTTCFPPEQPHHRASRRLFWLWDTSEQSDNTIKIMGRNVFFLSHAIILIFLCCPVEFLCRCFGYMATTSHGLRPEPSVTSGYWKSWIWVTTLHCATWKVEPSGAWRSCRACICIVASWPLSPMISSTSCTACNFSICR